MKGSLPLAILWFAFSAVKVDTSTAVTSAALASSATPADTSTAVTSAALASSATPGNTPADETSTPSTPLPTNSSSDSDITTVTQNSTEPASPPTAVTNTITAGNTPADEASTPSTPLPTNSSSDSDITTVTQSSTEPASPTTTVTSTIAAASPTPCDKNPCVSGANCTNLMDERVCQCSFGLYYIENQGCQQGKIFPGDLSLNTVPYSPSMKDKSSAEFKALYNIITQFFQGAFANRTDYKETIILSVSPSSSRLKKLREGEATVVSLINMFTMSSNLNTTEVQDLVQKALETNFNGSSFETKGQCETGQINCDEQTTSCTEKGLHTIATCACKAGFAKKNEPDTSCLLCDNCSEGNKMRCVLTARGIPNCQCMPDFHYKDGGCQQCGFGYSGDECKDNYIAVIVGVSIACGLVIIVLAGVLIYKSLRAKREPKPERRSLLSNDYSATPQGLESKSATNVTPGQLFPRIPTGNAASQGIQARAGGGEGLANKSYIPDRDYDDVDPSSMEMETRRRF